jgi:hypothetical protein
MKKTTQLLSIALLLNLSVSAQTQIAVADLETFNTTPNTIYTSTTSTPFQTSNAVFPYEWDTTYNYWAGGFSYTNKYDSANGSYTNLHGVRALKGYNNSNVYAVGQDKGIIKLKAPFNSADGFYITNTTYAFKTIKDGNAFARKFGDTTGTGSGTTIAQGSYPDWFKITVKAYFNGAMKNDSVEFYLADYRFTNNLQDYVVDTWQWVNTTALGQVDSIQFFMYSSDVGTFGINTPLFFGIDNLTTSNPYVGLAEYSTSSGSSLFPNPFQSSLTIRGASPGTLLITDVFGKLVYVEQFHQVETQIDLSSLAKGVYLAEIKAEGKSTFKKIIKE